MPPLKGILPEKWQERSRDWAKAVWANKANRPGARRYDRDDVDMSWPIQEWP
jgi:hypothetical protein